MYMLEDTIEAEVSIKRRKDVGILHSGDNMS